MLFVDFFHWLQLAGCIRSLLVRGCSITGSASGHKVGVIPDDEPPINCYRYRLVSCKRLICSRSETGEINETGQSLRPFLISLSRKRAKRIYYTITIKILLGYRHTMSPHEIDSFKNKIQCVFFSTFSNY